MDHTATDESPGAFRYTMETAPGARLAALSAALRTQDGVEVTERDGRTFLSVKFPLRDPEYSHEMQRLNQGYQLVWFSEDRPLTYEYPCTLTREPTSPSSGASEGEQKHTTQTTMTDKVVMRVTDHALSVAQVEEWARNKGIDLTTLLATAKTCTPTDVRSTAEGFEWATLPIECWPTDADDLKARGYWPHDSLDKIEARSGDNPDSCLGLVNLPVHYSGHDSLRVVEMEMNPVSLADVYHTST